MNCSTFNENANGTTRTLVSSVQTLLLRWQNEISRFIRRILSVVNSAGLGRPKKKHRLDEFNAAMNPLSPAAF